MVGVLPSAEGGVYMTRKGNYDVSDATMPPTTTKTCMARKNRTHHSQDGFLCRVNH
jgi:hypothetical protein